MTLRLFLNELSHVRGAPSHHQAREWMMRLLATLRACETHAYGQRLTLDCVQQYDDIMVGPEYAVVQWLNDNEVVREQRQYLLSILTRSRAPADREPSQNEDAECRYLRERAVAMTAAWLNEGMTVSLASAPCWDASWLRVELNQLNSSGDLEVRDEDLRHASTHEHVGAHVDWIRGLSRITVRDGRDLWDKRVQLFPSLEFCTEVRKQLVGFKSGDPALTQIQKRLCQMEEFFSSWEGVPIGPNSLPSNCTPESGETLKEYRNEHSFTRVSGQQHVFKWHVRFTPGAGRIFFDGDAEARKGIVGCIVRNKLPTVKYPT